MEKMTKTVKGIKRPIGIKIKAKCKKNKIGLPYRECIFPILFGYGIDDVTANIEFLEDVKGALEEIGVDIKTLPEITPEIKKKISDQVVKIWAETEEGFMPKSKKYV
jgi:hypothetical protein